MPIDKLSTCLWWAIARDLSRQDLSSLRCVSRQVQHELRMPYLERNFKHIFIDARAPPKHPVWAREEEDAPAAVRSLALRGHLYVTGGQAKPHFKFTAIHVHYAPITSIASFVNLRKLDIDMVNAEWLARFLPNDDLGRVLAANGDKIRELRLTRVLLSVNEIVQLLYAFHGSIEELSLHLDRCPTDERLELIRALAAMQLRKLDLRYFGDWRFGMPRCSKLIPGSGHTKQGSYVILGESFSGQGQGAVAAGLERVVKWWEAGNLG
ncbi:hypothetical protein LTS10_000858 [Elasticomyces elasticus]|nr:hypothetical protein LTS10_000858 [Elasticomyces elasticus]